MDSRMRRLLLVLSAALVATALWSPVAASGATITVNATPDQGDTNPADEACDSDAGTTGEQCTLRAAIETAQGSHPTYAGDDVVELPLGVTIDAGSNGELSFSANGALTVRGTGSNPSAIDANGTGRIFNASNVSLTLENIELREGVGEDGGGALRYRPDGAGDVLRLDGSRVEDSEATSDDLAEVYGGGILVEEAVLDAGATVQVVDSEIVGNIAGDDSTTGFGGGLSVLAHTPRSATTRRSVTPPASPGAPEEESGSSTPPQASRGAR
jgi:hypothetical protein